MGAIFAYSLIVSLTLMLCFGGYRIGRGGTPRLRRIVLLAIYAVALLAVPALLNVRPQGGAGIPMVDADAAPLPMVLISTHQGISPLSVIIMIYLMGVAACLLSIIAGVVKTVGVVRGAKKRIVFGCKVYVHNCSNLSPFSFGRMIVMNSEDAKNAAILIHESAHVSLRHTIDMIVAQLTAAICWYCPAAWQLRRELRLVHEFQADDAVISRGENTSDYSRLLVERAVGMRIMAIANRFNHNNLKQRIKMMQTPLSGRRGGKLRTLLPIAAMALSVIFISMPTISSAIKQISLSELALKGVDADNTAMPTFVIYGINRDSDSVKNGNFMTVTDFAVSDITAADVDGVILPKINAIFCNDKQVLNRLTPGVRRVMVDGKIMSVKEFSKIPAEKIKKVIICGEAMIVVTRKQIESRFFNSIEDAINAENK